MNDPLRGHPRIALLDRLGLRWMVVLVFLPLLTDVLETGGWPRSPREWLAEAVVGLEIAALVRQVLKEHLTVLALARSDALTGLGNRSAFGEAIEDEWFGPCAHVSP